jgi:3-phenylpropionate/cinnamic acid dioxygenase small subunit
MEMDLATLTALEELRLLKARYFRYLDTKDWAAWAEVFAEDASLYVEHAPPVPGVETPNTPTRTGRQTIVDSVSTLLADAVTVHHGHMGELELTSPTTARGVWAMEDIVETPDRWWHGHGHYTETYALEGGRWRIKTLRLTRLRSRRGEGAYT